MGFMGLIGLRFYGAFRVYSMGIFYICRVRYVYIYIYIEGP